MRRGYRGVSATRLYSLIRGVCCVCIGVYLWNVYRTNRAVQHDCDLDVRDKHHAQGIDDMAHQLRDRSCRVGFHPNVERVDNTLVSYVNLIF